MASAPKPNLPIFFNDLMPLNSRDHKGWHSKQFPDVSFVGKHHALPVTVDEFIDAQRHFPIVFSAGDNPVPLALMGLNEGVNTFVDENGKVTDPVYIPAYIRRYPFMLAKLQRDSDQLSLCFDSTSDAVGEFDEGRPLFENGEAAEATQQILDFCQNFEGAAQRTQAFIAQLIENDLLMDGEVSIQADGNDKPFLYRGFKMVDQDKVRELPAAKVEEFNKNGLMMLIHAHLFSLDNMRVVFSRQVQQGWKPEAIAENGAANV